MEQGLGDGTFTLTCIMPAFAMDVEVILEVEQVRSIRRIVYQFMFVLLKVVALGLHRRHCMFARRGWHRI